MNSLGYPEIAGHLFEILELKPMGDMWYAHFAVDGRPYPAFFEPKSNVHHMRTEEFEEYMKSQALTMASYVNDTVGHA